MVLVHGPNGETTAPSPDPAAVADVPAPEPAATAEPPVIAPPPDTDAPGDSGITGTRSARTFKFREDFAPVIDTGTAKTPRGPRIPDPPRTAGAAVPPAPAQSPVTADQADAVEDAAAETTGTSGLRQWALVAAAGVGGILLALLLLALVASWLAGRDESVAEADPAPQTSASVPNPTQDARDASSTERPDVAPRPDAEPAAATKQDASAAAGDAKDDLTQSENAANPPDAQNPDAATDASTQPPPTENMTDSDAPPDAAADPASDAATDAATDPAPTTDAQPPVPPTADVADNGTEPPAPATDVPADAATESLDAAGWHITIPALEFHDTPIVSFVDFAADFAGVAVSLDIDAMLVAQIPADTRLEFNQQQVTMEEVLQTALEPVGLTHVVENQRVVITPQRDVHGEVQHSTYDVSDLAADDEQTQALVQLVVTMIAPTSWAAKGGTAEIAAADQTLEIDQTEAGHFQVARLLDRLRAVRGLLPRSDLSEELLDVSPAFVRAGEQLSRSVSANFPAQTNVSRIVKYLRGETSLYLIVDWRATAPVNWTRESQSTLTAQDQPLGAVLDAWLEPQQLGYRVVDSKTIEITSIAALDSHPELELYPLKGDTDEGTEELIRDLKSQLGPGLFADAGGSGAVAVDRAARVLLVSLPQPAQRRAAEWLATADKLRVLTTTDPE